MTQYTKRMVIAHWLTLLLLIVAWLYGDTLDDARHAGSATLQLYWLHASVGGAILLLTLLRFTLRRTDGVPTPVGTGTMDKVATGIHHLLYTLLILIPVTGVLTVLTSKVGSALLAGDVTLLPKKYADAWAHSMHGLLVNVLIAVVVMHVLGALKHQFVLRDGLMSRMSLRKTD